MITFAAVHWSGWPVSRLLRLFLSVQRHWDREHYPGRFVCIAEDEAELRAAGAAFEIRPLGPTIPRLGNLPRMAVFDPAHGLDGRVIALNLDIDIRGPLTPFLRYRGPYATAGRPGEPTRPGMVLTSFYPPIAKSIWQAFRAHPELAALESVQQHGALAYAPVTPDLWEDVVPGRLRYYDRQSPRIPSRVRVVAFDRPPLGDVYDG